MSPKISVGPENSLFVGLSEEQVSEFTQGLNHIEYKKGEQISLENDDGRCLFVIEKGSVQLSNDLNSPDAPVEKLGPGEVFGDPGLLTDAPPSSEVIALENTRLLEIPRDDFVNLSNTHPVVMFNLVSIISGRLKVTNDRVTELMNDMVSKNRLLAIGLTASKIIHDIKTPLTVIVLTAQLIESLYPESAEFTASIIKQTKLVDELVRETMDYVKGTPTPIMVRKLDMNQFLKDLKDTYGASLKGRDINLRVENKCSDYVYFDEERIRRVVINLLRNASEALQEKGEIKIIASLASNWLQISVIDDGPGIPEGIVADLFKPFVTFGKPNGTGLGLPICQKLVQEHSGRIEYYPVEPHGARFDIRIPQNLH